LLGAVLDPPDEPALCELGQASRDQVPVDAVAGRELAAREPRRCSDELEDARGLAGAATAALEIVGRSVTRERISCRRARQPIEESGLARPHHACQSARAPYAASP
jgi:hypothetical protein